MEYHKTTTNVDKNASTIDKKELKKKLKIQLSNTC